MRWALCGSKGRACSDWLNFLASGSRCSSTSGRVSDVAVTGNTARLQIVANRRSLSSRPSGSAGEPAACAGCHHALCPTPAKPEKAYGSSCSVGVSGRQRGMDTRPGSTISYPSKNRVICSRERMISGLRMFR